MRQSKLSKLPRWQHNSSPLIRLRDSSRLPNLPLNRKA